MTVAGRNEAAEGTAGRRILFATENALGWNALLPIFIRLRQRTDITLSSIAVSYTVADAYKSWRFKSKESENIFRDLYVPADDVEVLAWDIFVVSHSLRIIDISPHQHIVSVPHGAGFGSGSYSLEKYSQSTLYCGFSPEEAGYIADHTGEPPPANRFIATGAPRNDRFAPFLGAPLAERTEKKRRLKSKALRQTSHWCWSRPTGRQTASCAPSVAGFWMPWLRLRGHAKLFKSRTQTCGKIRSSTVTIPRPDGPAKRDFRQHGFVTRWTRGIRLARQKYSMTSKARTR